MRRCFKTITLIAATSATIALFAAVTYAPDLLKIAAGFSLLIAVVAGTLWAVEADNDRALDEAIDHAASDCSGQG